MTHDKQKSHNTRSDISRSQGGQCRGRPVHLRIGRECVGVSRNTGEGSHETQDMRCAAVIGINTNRHHLTATDKPDDEVRNLMSRDDEELLLF